MDENSLDRLYSILGEATIQLRKGEPVVKRSEPGLEITEVFAMPHTDEAKDLAKVDVHFIDIGVNRAIAEKHRTEFTSLMRQLPAEMMAGGPSYITVGGEIGSQGGAFQMFALGKFLGLWDIITPATFGIDGPQADQMAGAGYIMISGLRPAA